jgi:hypothetical protein
VEALQALPSVQRYHASLGDGNQQLHVQGSNPCVTWPISTPTPSIETHREVIPELLRWTQWECMDRAWSQLRRELAPPHSDGRNVHHNHHTAATAPPPSRPDPRICGQQSLLVDHATRSMPGLVRTGGQSLCPGTSAGGHG